VATGREKNKKRRGTVIALLLMILLLAASGFAAWQVPVPPKPPEVVLKSPWVFRAYVFAGSFAILFLVGAACFNTITTRRPAKKIGFGPLSWEANDPIEKVAKSIGEGLEQLTAAHKQMSRKLDVVAVSSAAAHDSLVELASADVSDKAASVQNRAHQQLDALQAVGDESYDADRAFDAAAGKFDQAMSQIEEIKKTSREKEILG
jgi:hypothetical protein